MPDGVYDDFVGGRFIEHEMWVRGDDQTPGPRIVRLRPNERVARQEADGRPDFRLNALRAARVAMCSVLEDRLEIGERRTRIANPHRPCLAQAARTSSSLANSARFAAAFDRA